MTEFLQSITLLPVVLTLGTYLFGLWCRKKWNHPLVNPLLIAVILIIGILLITGVSIDSYQAGVAGLNWFLTPVTVCLAVPSMSRYKSSKPICRPF